jgi:chemotaxis protein methyltransferase WspC
MRELAIPSAGDYVLRLVEDSSELQKIISLVAVPETWFYRGGEVFTYLAGQVVERQRLARGSGKFRALSVPCSTGEEPYSFAIALAEAGIPSSACEIVALDICAGHLERAEKARYGEFSFRQMPTALRERYFRFCDGAWLLNPEIAAQVRFRQANLLDPLFLASEELFDLVFCRNLLIYLHKDARQQVLDTLERLLASDGRLCMGHAEPLEFLDPRFKRVGPDGHFLYQRSTASKETGASLHLSPVPLPQTDTGMPTLTLPKECVASTVRKDPPQEAITADRMVIARSLADDGKLDEALVICQTHLAQTGPSADLFSLMGVVHQARHEREDAARYYQRALYLDPAHLDALTHLMLLCQELGDPAQVERLRRRLERIAQMAQGGET